ncbi:putative disease resistance protein RGA1 [Cornus florida]|uniref:putative disease resistance protein RGA1 n=1 Tax=Cornus florida TaxID=4283 RepID=UPI0028A1A2F9|nr:putative disease resistance protein RGA1 [Cornus florida]
MHDLMHDLAVLVAKSESLMVKSDTKEVPPRICHVSVDLPSLNDRPWEIPAPLLGAIGIRTFFLPAQPLHFHVSYAVELENSLYAKIVSTFKRLRVLDLHTLRIETVPSCISKLTHLRYVDLSGNYGIETLPNSITELLNLQTLKLSNCGLKRLPREIRKLVSLRHLEIDGCHGLSDMPSGLGELTCLRALQEFKVGPSNRLSELKDLNNLWEKLSIVLPWRLPLLGRPRLKEAEEANLKEKQHLQSLIFDFGNSIDDDDGELESVLEALRPHTNLKKLEIKRYRGVRLPTWMSFLLNLVQISLENCNGCKHLPKLEQLPCLKSLSLDHLESVEYIDDNSCGGVNDESSSSSPSSSTEPTTTTATFFPSLENLYIMEMPKLKEWWRSKLGEDEEQSTANNQEERQLLSHPSFPCLVESDICFCPQLTSMPLQPTVVKLNFRQVSGRVVQEQLLTMAKETPTTVATSSSSLVPLSNLEQLDTWEIEDLVTLPEEAFRLLTSLLKLKIYSCPKLTSLSGGMRHLTTLVSLEIKSCKELDLSDGGMHFQGLRNLTSLRIVDIPKLVSLPAGLQHVTTLQSLYIDGCKNLESLPEWIGNLTSLQKLGICVCPSLKSLEISGVIGIRGEIMGGGNRRDDGSLVINNNNVFSALESLRKKKKTGKSKNNSSSNAQVLQGETCPISDPDGK